MEDLDAELLCCIVEIDQWNPSIIAKLACLTKGMASMSRTVLWPRYCQHRYPEITQSLLQVDTENLNDMPSEPLQNGASASLGELTGHAATRWMNSGQIDSVQTVFVQNTSVQAGSTVPAITPPFAPEGGWPRFAKFLSLCPWPRPHLHHENRLSREIGGQIFVDVRETVVWAAKGSDDCPCRSHNNNMDHQAVSIRGIIMGFHTSWIKRLLSSGNDGELGEEEEAEARIEETSLADSPASLPMAGLHFQDGQESHEGTFPSAVSELTIDYHDLKGAVDDSISTPFAPHFQEGSLNNWRDRVVVGLAADSPAWKVSQVAQADTLCSTSKSSHVLDKDNWREYFDPSSDESLCKANVARFLPGERSQCSSSPVARAMREVGEMSFGADRAGVAGERAKGRRCLICNSKMLDAIANPSCKPLLAEEVTNLFICSQGHFYGRLTPIPPPGNGPDAVHDPGNFYHDDNYDGWAAEINDDHEEIFEYL
eukprot:TRINITY_DN4312_c0_g1_i1.p1 TRINITY_DN4312_c0_g1~~TRINITY_DN4312_c0_g1_i1.p1  ORF type:complete len:483 (+),score=38.42 TRINITY_DN4312_c0_g1_i1:494-1942(+)